MEKKILLELLINGHISVPKLLFQTYHTIGLNEEEVMVLLHIQTFIDEGNGFPTPDELADRMTCTPAQSGDHLGRLAQRGLLKIIENNENLMYPESYSLQPLWEKLIDEYDHTVSEDNTVEQEEALYTIFESEFGRPLSPIECETLTMWLDQDRHSPDMVKAALRESVISGKLNFRYIDRILFEWKKNGVSSLEQAKKHGEKFRQNQRPTSSSHTEKKQMEKISLPMYNRSEG